MKYKLSIIIPVYNVQDHVGKCIISCLDQDLDSTEFEIVIINDGSTDNSEKIVQKYAKEHSNVKCITQQNKGVSSARNKGISVANGEYLLFVDADDTIKENSLNIIIQEISRRKNQLLILNSILIKNGNKIGEAHKFPKQLSSKKFTGIELFNANYSRGSVCGVVFKKQFIEHCKLKFSEKVKNGEDSLFMSLSFIYANSISHLDLNFYKVNLRDGSASRTWSFNKITDLLGNLEVINNYIENNNFNNKQLAILNIRAYEIISGSIFYFFSLQNLRGYKKIKNTIKNSPLYPIKRFGSKRYKLKIELLNFSLNLFCFPFLLRQMLKNLRT